MSAIGQSMDVVPRSIGNIVFGYDDVLSMARCRIFYWNATEDELNTISCYLKCVFKNSKCLS